MNETLMQTGSALMTAALADPAGAPSHPAIFLVLGVVTFALHIAAVAILLGSTGLALYAKIRTGDNWLRLGSTMAFTAKAAAGAAIVLGVAPLLFVQVIFDPFWYASSMISAVWTLIFLALLMAGYLMLYRVHAMEHPVEGYSTRPQVPWLAAALLLFIACGALMHVISNQALFPGNWLDWYAPGGQINASGWSLNYMHVARLLFFLALALPVTAGWIYGMRRWILSKAAARPEDGPYSDFLETVAFRMAQAGGILLLVFGLVWMLTLPAEQKWFVRSVWPYIGLLSVLYFLAMPYIQKKRRLCITCNYMGFVMAVVMTVVPAALREALRVGTLFEASGWNPMALAVNWDIPTLAIFFVTFLVVGGTSLAYILGMAWKAGLGFTGRPGEVWTPPAVLEKLGTIAVTLLVVWVIGYFAVGIALLF